MDKKQRDLLVFGYGLGVIAAVFALGGLMKHGISWAPVTLMLCSVIFTSVTAWQPQALKPGYAGWMKAAHLIGTVVTTVLLGGVFFIVFAPVGIVLRVLRIDHLNRCWDKSAATYWRQRSREEIQKERYQQQF